MEYVTKEFPVLVLDILVDEGVEINGVEYVTRNFSNVFKQSIVKFVENIT